MIPCAYFTGGTGTPLTAHVLIASLRSIPGWARMSHGQDGSPGPAGPIIALGVVIVAIVTLARTGGRRTS